MIYDIHTPAPSLAAYIDRIWFCSDSPPHSNELILPNGSFELVINLRDDEIRIYETSQPHRYKRFSGAVISGTYSKCFMIHTAVHASIIGVHFKPGGALPFIGIPASEMVNKHMDLQDLWGPSAVTLRERLCNASPEERFALLEEALLAHLRYPPSRHRAVSFALHTFPNSITPLKIYDIVQDIGLSQRRFIQLFKTEVGLTPKLYARLHRFHHARQLLTNTIAPNWTDIALECGYFDQSHMIREFADFSGMTPTAYWKQSSERVIPYHIPGVE